MKRVTLNCQKNCDFTQVKAYTPSQNTRALGYVSGMLLTGTRRGHPGVQGSRARARPPAAAWLRSPRHRDAVHTTLRPPRPPALHTAQKHCLQISEEGESTCLTMKH